jgi:hypothetical protein
MLSIGLALVCAPLAHADTLPTTDWLSRVQDGIVASEYRFTRQAADRVSDTCWHTVNRRHGWRAWFDDGGVRMVPRVETVPAWEWSWRLDGYRRAGALEAADPAHPVARDNRLVYAGGSVTQTFVNTPRGLEHRLELAGDIDSVRLRIGGTLVPPRGAGS